MQPDKNASDPGDERIGVDAVERAMTILNALGEAQGIGSAGLSRMADRIGRGIALLARRSRPSAWRSW